VPLFQIKMKKGYLIFICVIFLYAQETLWVRIFDQGAKEAGAALCFDNQGNILIAGGIWRSRETKWDVLFVKYTPNGEIIWTRYYDSGQSEGASCVELDREGNIVIGGGSGNDTVELQFFVAKFSSEGELIWRRDYRAGDLSCFYDLFIDDDNNIILCGDTYTYSGGGKSIAALFKYDANGNLLWKKFYNWAHSFYKMVPLSDSCFLVLGDIFDVAAHGFRILLIKFNSDGEPIWIKRYEGRRNFDYWAGGLALDSLGNIIVGGYELDINNNYDILLIKFTPNGDTIWSKRLNLIRFEEYISEVKIDKFGNIYAAGAIGKIDTCDYLLIKFTPDGETIWTTRYDNNDKDDKIVDLIIDSENNPIVTGYSRRYDYSDLDCLTIKYHGGTGISENFKQLISSNILQSNVERVEIYDINGRLIKKTKESQISLKEIKNGVYFIKIVANKKIYIKKLIKVY